MRSLGVPPTLAHTRPAAVGAGPHGPLRLTIEYQEKTMATIEENRPVDEERLNAFVFRAVEEVGATLNAALVVMGDKLGLYRALAGAGALTAAELAERAGVTERYVREWLNAQAAGGFVEYEPEG